MLAYRAAYNIRAGCCFVKCSLLHETLQRDMIHSNLVQYCHALRMEAMLLHAVWLSAKSRFREMLAQVRRERDLLGGAEEVGLNSLLNIQRDGLVRAGLDTLTAWNNFRGCVLETCVGHQALVTGNCSAAVLEITLSTDSAIMERFLCWISLEDWFFRVPVRPSYFLNLLLDIN